MSDDSRKELDTGGRAHPVCATESWVPDFGMTLLDYFAGQAMSALIRNWDSTCDLYGIADESYKIALVMVAEKRRLEATDDAEKRA